MRAIALALMLVFILSACMPSAANPTMQPLENAIQTASAATTAAGGTDQSAGPPTEVPPNYKIPIGSTAVLVCSVCDQVGGVISLWQTPDEVTSAGNVPNNTQVIILEETMRGDGKAYYKVNAGNIEGWIVKDMAFLLDDTMKSAIAATLTAQPRSGTTAIVVCDDCSALGVKTVLWQTPDELTALAELENNTEVIILEDMMRSDGKSFYKVQVGGQEGWIVKDLVKPK
jgi:hypothetical protein